MAAPSAFDSAFVKTDFLKKLVFNPDWHRQGEAAKAARREGQVRFQ